MCVCVCVKRLATVTWSDDGGSLTCRIETTENTYSRLPITTGPVAEMSMWVWVRGCSARLQEAIYCVPLIPAPICLGRDIWLMFGWIRAPASSTFGDEPDTRDLAVGSQRSQECQLCKERKNLFFFFRSEFLLIPSWGVSLATDTSFLNCSPLRFQN